MKPNRIFLFATLLALSALLAAGCTTTPQDAAGKTLITIQQTVDQTLKGWAKWVVLHENTTRPVAEATQARVQGAYEKYQAAMKVARTAYVSATSTNDPNALASALAAVTAAQAEIVQLVALLQKE